MPEFVATLLASTAFCLALLALNGLTRLLVQAHVGPNGLCENGFLQLGGALLVARAAYRLAPLR